MDKQALVDAIVRSGGKQNALDEVEALSYTMTFNDSTKAYTIAVSGAHLPLLAIAGPDQNIVSSTPVSVSLNGSASTDPNGTIVSYAWNELIKGVVTPVATGVTPTLTNVSLGVHTYP